MSLNIEISDSDLSGFNSASKDQLEKATIEFISNLVDEANRIESGRNTTSGPPEITSSMVNDAKVLLQRGLAIPKRKLGIRILRVFSAILSLVVGAMYDETKLQNEGYMLLFVFLIAITILSVTISTIKE